MDDIIPQQTSGSQKDNVAEIELAEPAHALERYQAARHKLLDVNHWGNISGFLSASFRLVDPAGQPVENRTPRPGDYFMIRIPAPAPLDAYDWVRVEDIEERDDGDQQMTAIRVRPAPAPLEPGGDTKHFFSNDATSSFIVQRQGNRVSAEVHGRNEKPNAAQASDLVSGVRNVAVAAGAMMGASDVQWNNLVKGLLK